MKDHKIVRYRVSLENIRKALLSFFREPSLFSFYQICYILIRYSNIAILQGYADNLMIKTLKRFSRFSKKDKYIQFGYDKFISVSPSLEIHLVGMYIDIAIKDRYYKTETSANEHNKIDFYYYQEGPYEIDEVKVEKGDIVIDAGANMGVFTLVAAKRGGYVYAFEPQHFFYSILVKNIIINSINNKVTCVPLAISNNKKTCSLYIDNQNPLSASILIKRGIISEKVQSISLDEWVKTNNVAHIDFIKADIEGAERLLLDGARETINRYHPKLAISIYHLSDDKHIIMKLISQINPNYKFYLTPKILFAKI